MSQQVPLTEAEQAVVSAVSKTIRHSSDPPARLAYLLPQIVVTAGFTRGVLILLRHGRLRVISSYGVPGTARGPSLLIKQAETVFRTREGLLAQAPHELCQLVDAEAVLVEPVIGLLRCHGAIMLGGSAEQFLDPATPEYLHELTTQLANALDHPNSKARFSIADVNRMILHKGRVSWHEFVDMFKAIL